MSSDALRHVNNSNYVAYLEQAAFDASAAAGWDLDAPDRTPAAACAPCGTTTSSISTPHSTASGSRVTALTTDRPADEVEHHAHLHRGDPHRPLLHARSRYRWTGVDGDHADAGGPPRRTFTVP